MNVENLSEVNDLMALSGFKLTELELGLLENSLTILRSSNKFERIFFVGRIETTGMENYYYYIAFGYNKDILKNRKFFYSLNGFEWNLMPESSKTLISVALNCQKLFSGDPSHVEEVAMVIKKKN